MSKLMTRFKNLTSNPRAATLVATNKLILPSIKGVRRKKRRKKKRKKKKEKKIGKKKKRKKKEKKKRRKKKGENNISFFKTRLVYCLDGWKAVFCPQRNNNQGRKTND